MSIIVDEIDEMTAESDVKTGPDAEYLFTKEFLVELGQEIEEKFNSLDTTNIIDDEVDIDEMTDESDVSNGPMENYLFTKDFLKELHREIDEKFDKPDSAEDFDNEIVSVTPKLDAKSGLIVHDFLTNEIFDRQIAFKTIGL